MENKKANIEQLEELHGLMATYFKGRLETAEVLPAGELNACLAFLKNNHVSASLTEDKPVQNLLEAFKDFDYELDGMDLYKIEHKPAKEEDE